ncbi:MAG: thiamine pyrophosphate-dependent enzyme, partial [Patescibacteria group bacterium]
METVLENNNNKKVLMLGDEAIVRGALEAGVNFVSTYPGTPASEIGNVFYRIAKEAGVYFEFSINEKVALEAGAGACFSGLKTMVAMKSFGLNVASDFLLPLVYSGVPNSLVLVVADDPGCSSSAQTEQDSRAYSFLAHIPTLEPSDVQECKDFTKLAFEISEQFKIPVMLRVTTRVALQSGEAVLGEIAKDAKQGKFVRNPQQYITMPPRVLELRAELLAKIEEIKEFAEKSGVNKFSIFNFQFSNKKVGIIASGVSYLYAMEALQELELDIPLLKLGFFYPLPEEKIKNFIADKEKVLIIEETEPLLEKEIAILAKSVNPELKILGKQSGELAEPNILPQAGELKPEIVLSAIAELAGKSLKIENCLPADEAGKLKIRPARSPQLCPGCPHFLTFQAVKKATEGADVVFGGEIGCYMLAGQYGLQDYIFCMGSGLGVGHGIKQANPEQKLISFIGDSSFFHS